MKALFVDIRHGDIDAVRVRLDRKPDLVHATAKSPPKKDDGQSPLQIALKTKHFDIAHLLLDRGADVNFMDSSDVNEWTVPVLHDALLAAVMSSRYLRLSNWDPANKQWEPANTAKRADDAYGLLLRMVDAGADVNAPDSYGNRPLDRVSLDARQVLPDYHRSDPTWVDPMPMSPDLVADLDRIYRLLLERGADLDAVNPSSEQTQADEYRDEPVAQFLHRT